MKDDFCTQSYTQAKLQPVAVGAPGSPGSKDPLGRGAVTTLLSATQPSALALPLALL